MFEYGCRFSRKLDFHPLLADSLAVQLERNLIAMAAAQRIDSIHIGFGSQRQPIDKRLAAAKLHVVYPHLVFPIGRGGETQERIAAAAAVVVFSDRPAVRIEDF